MAGTVEATICEHVMPADHPSKHLRPYRRIVEISSLGIAVLAVLFCITTEGLQRPPNGPRELAWSRSQSQPPLDEATAAELKYRVVESAPDPLPCPRLSPKERAEAVREFPQVEKSGPTIRTILSRLGWHESQKLGDDEKLVAVCIYRKMTSIYLEPWGEKFLVKSRSESSTPGEGNGGRSYVSIDRQGIIDSTSIGFSLPPGSPTPPPAPPQSIFTGKVPLPAIRYQLAIAFSPVQFCHPRHSVPLMDALREIQNDQDALKAILRHLNLSSGNADAINGLSDPQKRAVYDEYLRLRSIRVERLVNGYEFALATLIGHGGGFQIVGLMDAQGATTMLRKRNFGALPCPK